MTGGSVEWSESVLARVKKEKKQKAEKTGKKGGKKRLLILLLALAVLAGGAFAVVRFVLPNLGGGGEGEEPPKEVKAYTIGEDSVPALESILEEGEGELIANRGPGKVKDSSSGEVEEKYTYIYELEGYAAIMDRYLDLLMGEESFQLVDETYLLQEERPELEDAEGALLLVRPSVQEGRLFQLAIGWSQSSDNLAVRVAVPEGAIRRPEDIQEPEPASVNEQLSTLRSMTPAQLALPGMSMGEYDIYPVEGFVTIDSMLCRRFHIYEVGGTGALKGIIFLSGDQQHIFRMDIDDNSIITELKR